MCKGISTYIKGIFCFIEELTLLNEQLFVILVWCYVELFWKQDPDISSYDINLSRLSGWLLYF